MPFTHREDSEFIAELTEHAIILHERGALHGEPNTTLCGAIRNLHSVHSDDRLAYSTYMCRRCLHTEVST